MPATPCRPSGQGQCVLTTLSAPSCGSHVFKAASHTSPSSLAGPPPKHPLSLNADPRVEADTQGPALPAVTPPQNDQDMTPAWTSRKQQRSPRVSRGNERNPKASRPLRLWRTGAAGRTEVRGPCCWSRPPGRAAGLEATSVRGQVAQHCSTPHTPREIPCPCPSAQPQDGGRGGQACWGLLSSWCAAQRVAV